MTLWPKSAVGSNMSGHPHRTAWRPGPARTIACPRALGSTAPIAAGSVIFGLVDAVIYEGVDPATGNEKRRWVKAGPRKRDAEDLVAELVKRQPNTPQD